MTSDPIQYRLVRQKGQVDARKSYSIKFVPSFENDAPVEDGKWIKKIFESKSEQEALVLFEQHLRLIVSSGKPRAISLNNAREVLKFGHGKAHAMVSANPPRLVQVRTAAIHVAASKGWCRLLEELLANGAHWNCDSDVLVDGIEVLRSVTSLHWACAFNRRGVIQVLVKRDDADVNVRDGENCTPLMTAARFGYRNAMELLMENGADVNSVNDAGENALLVAAQSGHRDIVRFLVGSGVEIDDNISEELSKYDHLHRIDALGNTGLHVVCSIQLDSLVTSLIAARRKSSAGYLNEYLNVANSNHQTALHLAVASGSVKIVKELLSMGIKQDVRDIFGNTPLHIACLKGNVELVGCLLSDTDDVLLTLPNKEGWTPTHCSVASNKPEVLRVVLGRLEALHGGNISLAETPDVTGNSPLHLAVKLNSSEKIITELSGFNPYVRDHDGNSPIHVAARHSSDETFSALLQTFYSPSSNARYDVDHLNQRSESALLICVRETNVGKVRLLLEHNADLSPGGPGAATAMHHLVDGATVHSHQHNVETVYRMLVEHALERRFVDSESVCDQPRCTMNSKEVVRRVVLEMMLNTAHGGQNVLQYAAYQGALQLLQLVITDSTFVESSGTFNVTYLIPETVPLLDEVFNIEEQDRRSVVELIVVGGDDCAIVDILSREPFHAVISPYVMLINLVQYLMLLIHVANMSTFSLCTLQGRGKGVDTAYGMFLLWPFFNLFVDVTSLWIRLDSTRRSLSAAARMKQISSQFLSVLFSFVFALTTAMWCFVYYNSLNGRLYVCILSIVYLIGWSYTLTMFTVFNRIANLIAMIVVILYENVLPFLVVYAVQLIAFSLALFVLETWPAGWTNNIITGGFDNHTSTVSLGRVGFSSFFLALGVDLFDDLFSSRRQGSNSDDGSGYRVFVGMTIVLFEVITAVVMLNALIAMFTGTFYRRLANVQTKVKADSYRTVGSLMWLERHAGSNLCRCLRNVLYVLSNPKMLRSKSGRRPGMPYELMNTYFMEMPGDFMGKSGMKKN